MASVFQENYDKEFFILQNIFKVYHPLISELIKSPEVEQLLDIMCKRNMFNIESISEQTVSYIGGIEQSAEHGEDFKDMSELKVVTLRKQNENGYRLSIKNLHKKKNFIRLIVYNIIKKRLDYFAFRLDEIGFDKTKKTRIDPYYNVSKDRYSIIQNYKVNTFYEMCLAK